MFCHFWQKFKNSKWPPFLGRGKFFGKLHRLLSLDTLWVKNSVEIALSLTVSEILANYSKVVLKIHNEVPKFRQNFRPAKFSTRRVSENSTLANFPKIFPSPKMAAILNFRIFAQNGKTQICFYLLNRAR